MAAYHQVDDQWADCLYNTSGSAPGPTLSIEYGKLLPFTHIVLVVICLVDQQLRVTGR